MSILIGVLCIAICLYILVFSDVWGLRKSDREYEEWLANRRPIGNSSDIRSVDVE